MNTIVQPSAAEFALDTIWGRTLDADQRARINTDVRMRLVKRGHMVCKSGNRVEYWKGVMSGLVKMSVVSPTGKTSTLTGLAAGAWFGEGPVLRSDTWDFDGVAMHDTQLSLIPRQTFEWLLRVSPAFNTYVISQLNERLAQFVSIIETERLETADTRVARCLAWLFNPVLYPSVGTHLTLSQQEIGYLSGVSRQRVNTALRKIAHAGLVRVDYGGIEVLDLQGLQQFRADA